MNAADVSVAIPTFGREQVLLDTLHALLAKKPPAGEVLVIDQTPRHETEVEEQLRAWDATGVLRWLRLPRPSVPAAMNHALREARRPIVLFLDDDIVPAPGLVEAHAERYTEPDVWAVSGQVLQPSQVPCDSPPARTGDGIRQDLDFPFNGTRPAEVHNCMAGNLSVRRTRALEVGGFDENFVRVAYRFETEFCRRLWNHGGRVVFQPAASIRHLQAQRGGVRSYGHYLTTLRPHHAVGDYYFALGYGLRPTVAGYVLSRLRKSVCNRYHLKRPWRMPVTFVVEMAGLLWATALRLRAAVRTPWGRFATCRSDRQVTNLPHDPGPDTVIRLAHFVTHPIQYFAPLYRELARSEDLELTVFFGSDHGVRPSFDEGFGRELQFDVPLLEGYGSKFLRNVGSGKPSGRFRDFDCPTVGSELAAGRFDVLWVHGWGYRAQWQAISAARKLGIPYLVRGETTPLTSSASLLRRIARKLIVGRMLRGAAGCLYVGQGNRDFLRQMGVDEGRLYPAHYSVDTARFQAAADAVTDREHVRQRHGASHDTFVVATAAKAVRRKRLDEIIRAVARISPTVHLWVLGDGPERENLETLAASEAPGQVRWHGFVNQGQMPGLLACVDAFVLASEEETWGLVVNEAMACGLPVVCSDRVGCAADLVREGMTGYVYPVGDVAALAERIARLRADREATCRMGKAARTLVMRDYDVRTTTSQINVAVRAATSNSPARGRRNRGQKPGECVPLPPGGHPPWRE